MANASDESAHHSAIYTGWIRHRRFVPKNHAFNYPLFMLYLDLDELPDLFQNHWFFSNERFNVATFKRGDFFKPEEHDLKQAVIKKVETELALQNLTIPNIQSVRLLTHVRYFNFIFNPVSIYYCFDQKDQLCAVLAEINNTPWDERHAYVLPIGQSGSYGSYNQKGNHHHAFDFDKSFHVSPFNPMNMQYHWVFSLPGQNLRIHMDNLLNSTENNKEKHFDATLVMKRQPLSQRFGKTLIQFPLMTVRVSIGIYWQALKLWLKRAPFYDHPESKTENLIAEESAK